MKNIILHIKALPLPVLLLLFLLSFSGENYTLLTSIKTKSSGMTTDILGNLYLMNENLVEKYDANGKLLKSYANKNSGQLSSIDARDPFKVLVFFHDFSRIVFLDNSLSQQREVVNLSSFGFTDAGPVCSSALGGLWVYHGFNSELVKLDDQYKRIHTINLSTVIDLALKPDFMMEHGGKIYMNNPASGILVFDLYGTYIKTIPLKSLHGFQVKEDHIIYFAEGKLKTYNMKSFEENELALPTDSVQEARVEKDRLYVKKRGNVDVYSSK